MRHSYQGTIHRAVLYQSSRKREKHLPTVASQTFLQMSALVGCCWHGGQVTKMNKISRLKQRSTIFWRWFKWTFSCHWDKEPQDRCILLDHHFAIITIFGDSSLGGWLYYIMVRRRWYKRFGAINIIKIIRNDPSYCWKFKKNMCLHAAFSPGGLIESLGFRSQLKQLCLW